MLRRNLGTRILFPRSDKTKFAFSTHLPHVNCPTTPAKENRGTFRKLLVESRGPNWAICDHTQGVMMMMIIHIVPRAGVEK